METIHKDLQKIQSELKTPKSQYNSFGKYKYRSCEDILEAIKPIIGKMWYSITITDDVVLIWERYYVKATAKLSNWKDNIKVSALAREEETKKGMDWSQITGSSSSYARKYALNWLFAIDDTKDSDTTNDWKEEPKTATKEEPKKKPWFVDKNLDKFKQSLMEWKIEADTYEEAIKIIKKNYTIDKAMDNKVKDLYTN